MRIIAPLFQALAVLSLVAFPSAASATCLDANDAVTGELAHLTTRHPNGEKIEAWVLLTDGICVRLADSGASFDIEPRIIHLALPEGVDGEAALVGEPVTAKGHMEESITAWHVGDLIMFEAEFQD